MGSKLVGDYAKKQAGGLESMRRLFGNSDAFLKNSRTLVELRMNQISILDTDLCGSVQKAIRDLNNPSDSIAWARRIANRAFLLVWEREAPGREIPLSWLTDLREAARDRRIPTGGGACRLLQLATGTDTVPRLTKYVSKRTYALLTFIHSVGDHGAHLRESEVTWSYATAFCLAAVELCNSLADDLAPAPPGSNPTAVPAVP
jgi:hypothetical protein